MSNGETPGTDLVPITSLPEVKRSLLTNTALGEVVDAEQAAMEIMARILAAETVDDLFVAKTTTPAAEILGAPLEIDYVRWYPSSYKEGAPVFAAMVGRRLDGEGDDVIVTCSGRNVLAQLVRWLELREQAGDNGPMHFRITQAERATAKGFYPLWLERIVPPTPVAGKKAA